MKLAIAILAISVAFAAAVGLSSKKDVKFADAEFLEKQKFLFEIVYHADEPLLFEEWIKLGGELVLDESRYRTYNRYMDKFYASWQNGTLLPRGEHFSSATRYHMIQFPGLFNFFYYAKDWQTFQQNVCWARIHVNEGMFVHALTLAVIHREDLNGLILPAIHEIFPHHFFNSKFILAAEKFDYKSWTESNMYEAELMDMYPEDVIREDAMANAHVWQWWKFMGLDERRFYVEDRYMHRENIHEFTKDPMYVEMMKSLKMFWAPVDYSRDIEIFNDQSKLSYFTEDLGWNSYWYYLNYDYPFFLQADRFGLEKDRQGEWWIWNVQQILARYYMERLSHGYGDIDVLSWEQSFATGYNPQLIGYNGVPFTYRKNYWEIQSYGNDEMFNRLKDGYRRIYNIVDAGHYQLPNGTKIDFRRPEAIEFIGHILKGRVYEANFKYFTYWLTLSSMYFSGVDSNDRTVVPSSFTTFETMLRDPFFYVLYKTVTDIFYRFKHHLAPYTYDELLFQGVKIEHIHVGKLITYFDLVDTDVTSLLNDKMTFVDGQLQWNKTLLARQIRLNHRPFHFDITVSSDKAQQVVVRTFLGPKYDEFGRTILLTDNRENFMQIDEFSYDLFPGKNSIHRRSQEFMCTVKDRITYTELYRYVMLAQEGKYQFPLNISQPHCGFPDRLILPHGWYHGMPMQMFFIVTPYTANYEQYSSYDPSYLCGIGSGVRRIDNLPFGYPFDREINEYDFFVPNMHFKDVRIYHE